MENRSEFATKAASSKNAADVAATPYAVAVTMVLDRLEDKRRLLRFKPSLVSEPVANQPSMSRFEELETSTATDCGLLKQPDEAT